MTNPFDPSYKSVLADKMKKDAELQKARSHEVSKKRRDGHVAILKKGTPK